MTGYFAFPPTAYLSTQQSEQRTPLSSIQQAQTNATNDAENEETQHTDEKSAQEEAWARRRVEHEEKRHRRLEYERQQIWQSELEWVRSGGILRDAQGHRDKARTEMMRAEIRLQEEERRVQEEWDSYEARWRTLVSYAATKDVISWQDIPWPVHGMPTSPADITPQIVADFLFATFKIRGKTGSTKERIRASFLRWHPDKFPASVLAKVPDEERDMVVDGISAAFMSLKHLQDMEKRA